MLSMATQSGINGAFTHYPSISPQKLTTFNPLFKPSLSFKSNTSSSLQFSSSKRTYRRETILFAAPESLLETEEAAAAEKVTEVPQPIEEETQKLSVVVKPIEKPRLVLKFVWMEKNIGLALDQIIPDHGTVPLSPYYFWPRKDAWEELKSLLESKPWISQKKMIILLNQATDIINLWQQSGGNLS